MTSRPPYQLQIGQWIVNVEGRRNKVGQLVVYPIPKGDGGGKYEIAGINDRYHPAMAKHLRGLIELGQAQLAEETAVDYILGYTDLVARWALHPALEAFLRDCAFNRGPGGAGRILQIAVNVKQDGHVGPITLAAVRDRIHDVPALLLFLRKARETYERQIAPPTGDRAKFWKGLNSRWDKALKFSQSLLK